MEIDDINIGDIIEWERKGCPRYGISEVASLFGIPAVLINQDFVPLNKLEVLYVLAQEDFDKYKKKVRGEENGNN